MLDRAVWLMARGYAAQIRLGRNSDWMGILSNGNVYLYEIYRLPVPPQPDFEYFFEFIYHDLFFGVWLAI